MKKNRFFAIALLGFFSISLFSGFTTKSADDIIGLWYNGSKTGKIQIYKSGNEYFGKIVWLKEPTNADGTQKLDAKNADESKRKYPIMGMQILKNFVYNKSDNTWEDGKIYDPKNGKTYSCIIKMENGTLKVRGYIGISLIGRTDIWTRTN